MRQVHLPRGGIQRREQLVFSEDTFAGERVKERRFSGVRVADERDVNFFLAVAPPDVPSLFYRVQCLFDLGDVSADPTSVHLKLRFAGAAEVAPAAASTPGCEA